MQASNDMMVMMIISSEKIAEAVRVLREGGVVAHPTDTCYGLAADIKNPKALQRLYELKGMAESKPVSILVSSMEMAQEYGVFSDLAMRFARDFWPGALTLIVPRSSNVPDFLNSGVEGIGLRLVSEPFTVALLEAFGGPLTTTSANAHGQPSPYSVEEISMVPDFILDGGTLNKDVLPSTIISVEGKEATVIRQGNLSIQSLG